MAARHSRLVPCAAARRAIRGGALALAALLPFGCNLILDVGDHRLREDGAGAGAAAEPSSGGGGSAAGSGGAGGAGAGSGAGPGGAGDCPGTVTWSPSTPGAQRIACGQPHPISVAADGDWVYWINEATAPNTGQIMRVSREGGEVKLLASGLGNPRVVRNYPSQTVLLFGEDFGGTGELGLLRVPKDSGDVTPVFADGLGTAVLVLLGAAYSEAWKADEPARVRKSGGNLSGCYVYTSDGQPGGRIGGLAGDGTDPGFLFIADNSAGVGAIRRIPIASGCPSNAPVTFASEQTDVRWMVKLVPHVFWITAGALRYKVETDPSSIKPTSVLEDGHDLRGLTALTSTIVAYTSAADGEVILADVMLGTKKVLASGQGEPYGVVDHQSASIYWTNRQSGEIMRLDDWE